MKTILKSALRRVPFLGESLITAYKTLFLRRQYDGLSRAETFQRIYASKAWGGADDFNSGSGSHDSAVVAPYVALLTQRIQSACGEKKPVIVDIGCGDFAVGQQLTSLASQYIACDIVPELIERNRARFAGLENVVFRTLDAVTDALPQGDIILIRQVLQHLSNADIALVAAKIAAFDTAYVTEHFPHPENWREENIDMPHGADIRLLRGSAVCLDKPPFNLSGSYVEVLSVPDTSHLGGFIKTFCYQKSC